jgi:hypothetical protein
MFLFLLLTTLHTLYNRVLEHQRNNDPPARQGLISLTSKYHPGDIARFSSSSKGIKEFSSHTATDCRSPPSHTPQRQNHIIKYTPAPYAPPYTSLPYATPSVELRIVTSTALSTSQLDLSFPPPIPARPAPYGPARPRALQPCAPHALRFGIVTWRMADAPLVNLIGMAFGHAKRRARYKNDPLPQNIGPRPAADLRSARSTRTTTKPANTTGDIARFFLIFQGDPGFQRPKRPKDSISFNTRKRSVRRRDGRPRSRC